MYFVISISHDDKSFVYIDTTIRVNTAAQAGQYVTYVDKMTHGVINKANMYNSISIGRHDGYRNVIKCMLLS